MGYQISKEIGACSCVLRGHVDAIVITGGLAKDEELIHQIRSHTQWIAEIILYPGEKEMEALALGALRILRGEEEVKVY